uniref:Uncharacterized protein n=1 Tax=Chromera velia CCMP2878 TaxID=1169474 RepID=A0A0G4IB54_9ALVE|eukprot:Cvel_12759.t1-p1 / transcript=Cvel_12759.t1 / gene=Cvel_12759 / organism=Chromera_velia_CCMP2878 / gene_product=hypothetical protein / transcript_product=hypothetical protein / location=Cvel_scaffold848:42165-43334(+) / protein_length=390 / sequence_SO=supercontig / SO=protein_coding / is_pseudo=false
MALRDTISAGGVDLIFPFAVPFLSLLDILRLRNAAKVLRKDVDGSKQLEARTKEAWALFPDKSAVPRQQWQDFPNLIKVLSCWFDGDRRVLKALLGGPGDASLLHGLAASIVQHEEHEGEDGEEPPPPEHALPVPPVDPAYAKPTLFILPRAPYTFPNPPDGSSPAYLVTTLSDIWIAELEDDFNPGSVTPTSVLNFFAAGGRSFAMGIVHTPAFHIPTDKKALSVSVWDTTPDAHIRIANALDQDMAFLGEQQNKENIKAAAVSKVRFVVSLWNWRSSSFMSFDLTAVRTYEAITDLQNEAAPRGTGVPLESIFDTSTDRACSRTLYKYQDDSPHKFADLPMTKALMSAVLAGPLGILVAKVRVLHYQDWYPYAKGTAEKGGGVPELTR